MKVSKEFVGKVVAIQVGRPLYIMDYAAHVAMPNEPMTLLIGEPAMAEPGKPHAMDVLLGALVEDVQDDSVLVTMVTPGNHFSRAQIPSAIILQIVEITSFEPAELPTVTARKRQSSPEQPKSKIIL